MITCRNCDRLREENLSFKKKLGLLNMRFDDLWDIIVDKNKNLKNDKEVRMSVDGFKKAVKLTYEKGYEEGHSVASSEKSLFDNIFGNRRP